MKILFVCEYNACRSQIAEGLARSLFPVTHSFASAGLYPGEVHPITVEVMREIGVDLSGHRSKRLQDVAGEKFDIAVVLAEPAFEPTLALGAKRTVLAALPDPAAQVFDPEDLKKRLRKCRDELRTRLSRSDDIFRAFRGGI